MWAWGWTIAGVALLVVGLEWRLVRRERRKVWESRLRDDEIRGRAAVAWNDPPAPLEEPKVLGRIGRRP